VSRFNLKGRINYLPVPFSFYDESRSGSVASGFLGDFQGYLQTDGYSGYDFLEGEKGTGN
jgi:transposase